ncbi:DedA family protein [Balneolales bacterium ANBcel1]|nr:DedA family protein [Balneolales bacterium ANBcel1]
MTEFIFMIFESISWPAALTIGFFLLLLHGIFLTPPSELSLAAIGLYATLHEWLFFPALLVTTAGNMVGCVILFKISRRYSTWITNFLQTSRFRYVNYLIQKARSDFHKYDQLFVLYGRFIPNIRSVISIPAGFSNMPLSTYILYSGIGCLVWSLFWISVGYFAGQPLLRIIETHQTLALILLILTILVFVAHRYHILRTRDLASGEG